ncbi:probable leucine-rich repeat receptor-like protein kinase At1g68400 isoform X2 [Coffea arabica]|uniref:Probable leucine-rich repeat receptor-like protein kinase At1g68400 isoform X2 n=1 Tax=Coffea arabica TaxID=13443 RepID=A0A6P6X8V6_COFAR
MKVCFSIVHVTAVAFLLVVLNLFPSCGAVEEFFPDERNALIQLREIFSSSNGNLHGNWTGPPCYKNQSRWAGIGCSNSHVTHIVLDGLNLKASLPTMLLQNVTFLTKISFRDNFLYGPLPNLSSLQDLEFLFLSNNHFSGPIPVVYAQLPKLIQLELQVNSLQGSIPPFDQATLINFNVSHNQLSGPIPETAALKRFPKSSYNFNSNLCGTPIQVRCQVSSPPPPSNGSVPILIPPPPAPESGKGSLKIWSIALIAAAAALVPLCIMLFFLCYYRRIYPKKTKTEQPGEGITDVRGKKTHWSESTDDPERKVELEFFNTSRPFFDLDDLLRASAEVIGRGKLGTAYKAMLECGLLVAVKRLKDMNDLSSKEFIQQLQLLGKLRHQNLVEIISFYYSKEEKLIIYEYVPQGNLFQLIHDNRRFRQQPLNWRTRLSIIKDIAKGLNFLHQSLPSHKVPHGNLKSSNVLLQDYTNANQGIVKGGYYHCKLTDYGFLPLLPSGKSSQKLAVAKSPEFCQGKRLTAKADIYCFGILVLEIITGKTPAGHNWATRAQESYEDYDVVDDLSDWVRTVVNNDWSTDILDMEILAEKEGYDEMLKLTNIALECTDIAPENRPKMNEILRRIEEVDTTQV